MGLWSECCSVKSIMSIFGRSQRVKSRQQHFAAMKCLDMCSNPFSSRILRRKGTNEKVRGCEMWGCERVRDAPMILFRDALDSEEPWKQYKAVKLKKKTAYHILVWFEDLLTWRNKKQAIGLRRNWNCMATQSVDWKICSFAEKNTRYPWNFPSDAGRCRGFLTGLFSIPRTSQSMMLTIITKRLEAQPILAQIPV